MHDHRILPSIPASKERTWTLQVNGETLPCDSAQLASPFGTWSYGLHPGGFDTWWFAEEGGGGAILLPVATVDGELLIGLIEEIRPNMGGRVLCAIGGFKDFGEGHGAAGAREAREEAGLDGETFPLPGLPICPNRAFFVMDPSQGLGVRCLTLTVEVERLAWDTDSKRFILTTPSGAEVPQIVFLPWRDAVRETADGLALAAIARLLAGDPHE